MTRKQSEVITSKISLITIPYDHREDNSFMVVCVCNSVIRLFPETNHVGEKIFRSKHEIIFEKYSNVFEDLFEKPNTLWKCLNTNTFLYGKLKYIYLKKVFKYFQIQMYLIPCLVSRHSWKVMLSGECTEWRWRSVFSIKSNSVLCMGKL